MLKARDLNEGNIVQQSGTNGVLREVLVTTITINTVSKTPTEFYPVPITPKLLVDRCGMSEGDGTFNSLGTDSGTINIIRAFMPHGGYVFCYQGVKVPLEGLHHLQNIYYNIFGEELKIK